MICETKATKGSAKSLEYQSNDKGFAVEICRNGLIGDNPKEWHAQMRAIENQYSRSNFENKRITQVISLTREEAQEMKTAKDWEDLAKKHYEEKGINLENHAYIMHTHGSTQNPHLHITVSRVTFSGKQGIKDGRIGEEFGKITNKISKERGWKTAQETAELKRSDIAKNINEVLQKEKVKDFEEFKSAMASRGYSVKLSKNEAKGVYGMRIIPSEEYTETPSPRLAKSGQGYKLSEIPKAEGQKFKIDQIKAAIASNSEYLKRPREKYTVAETCRNIDNFLESCRRKKFLSPALLGAMKRQSAIKSEMLKNPSGFDQEKLFQINRYMPQEQKQEKYPSLTTLKEREQEQQDPDKQQEQQQDPDKQQEKRRGFRR